MLLYLAEFYLNWHCDKAIFAAFLTLLAGKERFFNFKQPLVLSCS